MNRRGITKVIIGTVVIGAATAYLLQQSVESSWVYYYSVDEFVERRFGEMSGDGDAGASKVDKNRIIRLAGRAKEGTIVKIQETMRLDFELAGQNSSVAVRFYGVVPRNFAADKEVVVEGKVGANGVFEANKILTRCESKYKVRVKSQDQRL